MDGRHWLRSALVMTLLGGVLTLTIAAGANAGTYVIDNCPAAMAGDYSVGPWAQFGSLTGPGSFTQTCVTSNDSFGIASNGIPSNATAGEELQTPPSITMQHIKLWWEAPSPVAGGGWSYGLIDVYSPGWSRIFQSTTPVVADGAGKTAPTELSLPTNTSKLDVEIYCTTSLNCTYNENPLQIYGSELTLADSNLPSGTVIGGALAGTGTLSGTQSLSYDVQDADSGVRLVQLRVDGQPAAQNDYAASCPYTDFLACPPSESNTISWNTASVADGEHSLELTVEDAAHNTSVIYAGTITTANAPAKTSPLGAPPGPGTGGGTSAALAAVGSGTPNGSGASEGAHLQLGCTRRCPESTPSERCE